MKTLSIKEIDGVRDAIRAAQMIATVVSRTLCEGMRKTDGDDQWKLDPLDGDMLDYFTGAQVSALEVVLAKFEEVTDYDGGEKP